MKRRVFNPGVNRRATNGCGHEPDAQVAEFVYGARFVVGCLPPALFFDRCGPLVAGSDEGNEVMREKERRASAAGLLGLGPLPCAPYCRQRALPAACGAYPEPRGRRSPDKRSAEALAQGVAHTLLHAAAPLPLPRHSLRVADVARVAYPQRAEALAVDIREDGLPSLSPLALHRAADSCTDRGHLSSQQLEKRWAGHLPVGAREHQHLGAFRKRLRQLSPASHVGLPCQHEDEMRCLRHGLGDVTASSCPWPGAQS